MNKPNSNLLYLYNVILAIDPTLQLDIVFDEIFKDKRQKPFRTMSAMVNDLNKQLED